MKNNLHRYVKVACYVFLVLSILSVVRGEYEVRQIQNSRARFAKTRLQKIHEFETALQNSSLSKQDANLLREKLDQWKRVSIIPPLYFIGNARGAGIVWAIGFLFMAIACLFFGRKNAVQKSKSSPSPNENLNLK